MAQYDKQVWSTQDEPVIGQPVGPGQHMQDPAAYGQQANSYGQAPDGYWQGKGYQDVHSMGVEEAPMQLLPGGAQTGKWTTGLCDCGSDCSSCCVTFWCPCITFGQVAEMVDEGRTSCVVHGLIYGLLCQFGVPCVYSCLTRRKLREKYHLESGGCGDFGIHCCCEYCALCQEHRELKNRGYDPTLGWEAHRQMMNSNQRPMAPPTPATGMVK